MAAFTNIRRSLRPHGGLALLAWRDLLKNEWVAGIREALSLGRVLPLPAVGAPGPFALADRDHTAGVLSQAGFVDVRFDQVDEPIRLGDTADDAFSFVSTFGITRGLTHDLDDAGRAAALEALHASLDAHSTGDGALSAGRLGWSLRRGLRRSILGTANGSSRPAYHRPRPSPFDWAHVERSATAGEGGGDQVSTRRISTPDWSPAKGSKRTAR